jgi:tripartite-type tricarboxylate transporter receptor subunit TctC
MRSVTSLAGLVFPAALISLALSPFGASPAHAQADFYKGKTVSVVIGAKTGSLALSAQIVAQHLGRYIPGNPTVIFRQMPGGAHLGATGYVYTAADPDGLTVLAANPGVAMAQLAGLPQVRFDIQKFEWLGSSGSDGALFSIRSDLPYKTFQEFKDSGRELIAGTTGPGSNAYDMPLLLKEFAGANLKLLKGYAANSDILLAIDRKEVDAYAALGTTIKLAVERGSVRALVRARAPVPGFNDLPIDEELTSDPIGKSLMAIRGIPLLIGRPLAVRPGTPPERVAILREALAKALTDPELQAEAKKAQIDINYISGPDVTKSFGEMMSQPPAVVEAMKKYLSPGE